MKEKNGCPDPNDIFPNEFGTTCFLKNVVKAPNIEIGDYTCYDDAAAVSYTHLTTACFARTRATRWRRCSARTARTTSISSA